MVIISKNSHLLETFMCLFLLSVGHAYSPYFFKTGTDQILMPSMRARPVEVILWKYNQHKVVEYDSSGTTWYRFRDRGRLDVMTGALTILKMRTADSGLYQADIQVDGKIQNSIFNIKVVDEVSMPKVTCEGNDTLKILRCSVDSPVEQPLTWTGPDGFQRTGDTIIIKLPNSDSVYTCTAKNEVSLKNTEFSLKDCGKDNGLLVGIIVGVLLVTITVIILFVLYRHFRNNKGRYTSRYW